MNGRGIDAERGSGTFTARGIEVDPERLLRMLGYQAGAAVRPQVAGTAQTVAGLVRSAAVAQAAYRHVAIASCTPAGLVLSTATRFNGPTFLAALSGCEAVVVFVLSLGARFDTTQQNLAASGRTLEAYLLELAGWLAIEEATRRLKQHLKAEVAGDALALTRRMAPGYTTRVEGEKVAWPLEDQQALFSLFDPGRLPARLLEGSCAMTPKMSRSGMFGLAPALARQAPAHAAVSPGINGVRQETMQDE